MDINARAAFQADAVQDAIDGALANVWTVIPVIVQSGDGHTATVQPAIKGIVKMPDGTITNPAMPLLQDLPIHYAGGGGVSSTHPVTQGDEGVVVFTSRNQDSWHQSGGSENLPVDKRTHHLSDGRYIPGGRSNPRKLPNVSSTSHQTRSDNGKVTIDTHPTGGITHKTVDPSDSSANPFTSATKYHSTTHDPSAGITHKSVDGSTTHSMSVDHTNGPKMSAANGAHTVSVSPTGGVSISSTSSISLSAPSVSVPGGGVGALGGDLSGSLPNPNVVSILHVVGANALGNFANDAAAATGGVIVGALYRNGSILMVRVT